MGSQYGYGRFSLVSRIMAVGLLSGLAAGCSSDTMRFASDPFSNPFNGRQAGPTATGSLAAPAGAVQSAPLPAPSGEGAQIAGADASGWSRDGGFPIIVREGETLTSIADRYAVPASVILSVNGLTRATDIAPGSAIMIPVPRGGAQVASAAPGAPGPTVISASPASAEQAPVRTASASPAAQSVATPPRRPQTASSPVQNQRAPAPPVRSDSAPQQTAAPVQNARESAGPERAQPTATASLPAADASGLDFRWPARGRVIAGFGAAGNEGINIALPEGTQVRAAEGGVVAYAGNELKGYGNLVLIRHDNGYVSAYAHNRDILVKRGDSVRRGQVIANSGRTGNVNAPQLHFEIRKGSDPVDPLPYLRG
ncbi:MAG: M23 family metallopeptidase [Salinarimonadaceae bacterium]|nr:MAG: M23 family metallopeptidase [Salinarimonadaceae bacterium]